MQEADLCESEGIKCEITTTTAPPLTTTTTMTTAARTTKSTAYPRLEPTTHMHSFGRFTARPRVRLPSWKQRPLPPSPPGHPLTSEETNERGQPAALPPFERKVPVTNFDDLHDGYSAKVSYQNQERPNVVSLHAYLCRHVQCMYAPKYSMTFAISDFYTFATPSI